MTKTTPPDAAEFGDDADELTARRRFMVSRGFRFCSMPACNCNSWHGGHDERLLDELDGLLQKYDERRNGELLTEAIERLLKEAGKNDD